MCVRDVVARRETEYDHLLVWFAFRGDSPCGGFSRRTMALPLPLQPMGFPWHAMECRGTPWPCRGLSWQCRGLSWLAIGTAMVCHQKVK